MDKKKAIEICKELWTFLAETGLKKERWEGWEKYGEMESGCPLCEYCNQLDIDCDECPYELEFGACTDDDSPYSQWCDATTKPKRKKYAKEFLAQLEQL